LRFTTWVEGREREEAILILLKAGADTKAKDGIGQTALDYAQNNLSLKSADALRKIEEASQ